MLITALIIAALLAALIFSHVRPTALFTMAVAGLYMAGEVQQTEVLSNVTNSSVLTLIFLMVASLALERSAILPWLSSKFFCQVITPRSFA